MNCKHFALIGAGLALALLLCACPSPIASSDKAISAYSFAAPAVDGTINGTDIAVHVPYGTDLGALVASFTTTGVAVKVGDATQVSGTTPNDFRNPVAYRVIAADASTATYTVTVTVDPRPNRAPGAISLSAATAVERIPPGQAVGTLSAADPDDGDTVILSLPEGEADNASFGITDGTLVTKASLLISEGATRTVRVRATDSGGLNLDKDFTITLEEVISLYGTWEVGGDRWVFTDTVLYFNGTTCPLVRLDNAARQALYQYTANGTTVYCKFAWGADLGVFQYAVAATADEAWASTRWNWSSPNPPTLFSANPYAPFQLRLWGGTIATGAANGAVSHPVIAQDVQSGDAISYSLPPGLGDNGLFTIAAGTYDGIDCGILSSTFTADFAAKPTYALKIRATDSHGFSSLFDYTVYVRATPAGSGSFALAGTWNAALGAAHGGGSATLKISQGGMDFQTDSGLFGCVVVSLDYATKTGVMACVYHPAMRFNACYIKFAWAESGTGYTLKHSNFGGTYSYAAALALNTGSDLVTTWNLTAP